MRTAEEKLIIAGFGGQGVMLMGQMLSYAATEETLNTIWIPSYGPETRGGTANCHVTISVDMINSPIITKPDSVLALNLPSLQKFEGRLKENGLLIVNASLIKDYNYRNDVRLIKVNANDIALKLGNLKVANMVMLGAYLEASGVFPKESIFKILEKMFAGDKAALIDINKKALEEGIRIAQES